MSAVQKKNLYILLAIGAVYFILFFFPNATGAENEHMMLVFSNDETIIYPYVMRMLEFGKDIHEIWGRLIIYGDYHYGYPFYFVSFLVLLPVRLIFGDQYTAHTQLNMLLMRQFVSTLPMILALGMVTYLQTRLKSTWRSIVLFVFLLFVRGFVFQNLSWWHPDALAVLMVVLTIFFLDRDKLHFGKNFYFAAFTCGMATAIKLVGFFFVFAIAAILLGGLFQRRVSFLKVLKAAAVFLVVMAFTIVLSNPFLFYSSQREKMLEIQRQKNYEMTYGYTHDDPTYYQKGPQWWEDNLTQWYGPPAFLLFLSLSLIIGCLTGEERFLNRIILLWSLPYSVYLLYFVAPKPHHYWFPAMIPLFSALLNLTSALESPVSAEPKRAHLIKIGQRVLVVGVLAILSAQGLEYLGPDYSLYMKILLRDVAYYKDLSFEFLHLIG